MAQVVLSLKEESDKKLRKLAQELHGGKKGAMSEVVEDALDIFEQLSKREKAWKRLLELSKNARDLGVGKFNREEAHER